MLQIRIPFVTNLSKVQLHCTWPVTDKKYQYYNRPAQMERRGSTRRDEACRCRGKFIRMAIHKKLVNVRFFKDFSLWDGFFFFSPLAFSLLHILRKSATMECASCASLHISLHHIAIKSCWKSALHLVLYCFRSFI